MATASTARRVLVTGASSGVGAALARKLASRGAALALVGRSRERLEKVASEATARGAQVAAALPLDLMLPEASPAAWQGALRSLGASPTAVVCCHGTGVHGPADGVSMADFDACFAVNVRSVFSLLRAALPPMRDAGAGHFVTVSSVLGRGCASDRVLYCGTKHAVEGIMGAARRDLEGSGVQCSTVCPAAIDTPWWDRPLYPDGERRPKPGAEHLLTADEVADAILAQLEQPPDSDIAAVVLRKGRLPELIR